MNVLSGELRQDLDGLIDWAVRLGGSDLLITHGSSPMVRLTGELYPIEQYPPYPDDELARLIGSLLSPQDAQVLATERQVDFSFGWRNQARVRGNAFVQRGHPAVALRIIPDRIPTLDEIGVPPQVRDLMNLPQGLILFTGPTGSGKSTTQAAMIDYVNHQRAVHVLTLEDPIEYVHPHGRGLVNQREVGTDCLSFAHGLRAALREDPDVLLVGEMRDPDSIGITLTIAETGHLVLSTLHTNDTASAVDRIVDVFPADRQDQVRVQLAGSLVAVVAQRLVPRVGGGMVAAWEVLLANHAVRNLIREGKTRQIRNVLTLSQPEGMFTLEQSLSSLVAHGIVSHADAVSRSMIPGEVDAPPATVGNGR
ncbi:MAG: type IV pilus twitching motility protein PilT [Acidimicrobiales bacterium]